MQSADYKAGATCALEQLGIRVKHAVSNKWVFKKLVNSMGKGIELERLRNFKGKMHALTNKNSMGSGAIYTAKPNKAIDMAETLVSSTTGKSKYVRPPTV